MTRGGKSGFLGKFTAAGKSTMERTHCIAPLSCVVGSPLGPVYQSLVVYRLVHAPVIDSSVARKRGSTPRQGGFIFGHVEPITPELSHSAHLSTSGRDLSLSEN